MAKAWLGMVSVGALLVAQSVQAADLVLYPEPVAEMPAEFVLPAVSGVNGKVELDLGYLTDPESPVFRAGASLSVPVGDAFGLQGDLSVQSIDGDWAWGGALHAFTRDPSSYLLGVTGGYLLTDDATLAVIGPEAELYLDQLSLEGWAGYAALDYDSGLMTDETGVFAIGDIAYYVTDDWRLSIGAASILGYESLNIATEYQFGHLGVPLSLSAEARWYEDDAVRATIGLKGYFGDPDKSLIERHRQDDPPNRPLGLTGAAGNLLYAGPVMEEEEQEGPEEFIKTDPCFPVITDYIRCL
jgi:hypothetical protein